MTAGIYQEDPVEHKYFTDFFDEIITKLVSEFPEADAVLFHGSNATGTAHDAGEPDDEDGCHEMASDWDILLVLPSDYSEMHDYLAVVKFCQELNRKYEGFDIQPGMEDSSIAISAAEEGRLLWRNDTKKHQLRM